MATTGVDNISDDLTIVWLGPFRERYLSTTITFSQTFDSIEECLPYLSSLKNSDRIYFVMVTNTTITDIPRILVYSQIIWLYVLTAIKIEQPLIHETRLRGIFYKFNLLLDQLQKDIHFFYRSLSPTWNVFDWPVDQNSLSELNADNASFVWHQLLLDILLKMSAKDDVNAKQEFLAECRYVYFGDLIEEGRIDRFEREYQSQNAIQWYSDDGFVYRLLNRALRTQNIDIIYKCRFMLRELHKQLHDVQQSDDLPIEVVYRGQQITTVELDKLSRSNGHLIAMSSFLSTSIDRKVAQMYIDEGNIPDAIEWLISTIRIDEGFTTSPVFAYIGTSNFTKKPDEVEVLFAPGTVFRVETPPYRQQNERFWRMNLTLARNEQCAEINHVMNDIRAKHARHPVSLLTLGSVLAELGQFQSALRFYQMLLQHGISELPNPHHNPAAVAYSDIGSLYYDNGQFNEAIRFFDRALELFWQCVPRNLVSLITMCMHKGLAFTDAARYPEAMLAFVCALILVQMLQEACTNDSYWEQRAELYNNIGLLAQRMKRFRVSHDYYQRTKAILEQRAPHDYIRLNKVYLNIATLYDDCQQYDNAISFYEKVIGTQEKMLPPKHALFSKLYTSIGLCHANRGSTDEALRYMNMSFEIECAQQSINHVTLAICCNGLAVVSTFRSECDKALRWAIEAHNHGRQAGLADDHPDMQLYQISLERAIQNFEQYTAVA